MLRKNPITRGNIETVTTKIAEQDNSQEISGTSIDGIITYVSGLTKSFSGTSDGNGEFSYSWKIGGNSDLELSK